MLVSRAFKPHQAFSIVSLQNKLDKMGREVRRNFDIILGTFPAHFPAHPALHTAWAMLYLVPVLIGC